MSQGEKNASWFKVFVHITFESFYHYPNGIDSKQEVDNAPNGKCIIGRGEQAIDVVAELCHVSIVDKASGYQIIPINNGYNGKQVEEAK